VGVVGGGQRRNAISKYPTRKAYIRRKLVLIHWAKKLLKPPNMALKEKLLQGHLASKLANKCHNKGIHQKICPFCL
jgi:hypothetical protein